jgi:hypothetical protein
MHAHEHFGLISRQTQRAIHIVAAFYVVVGLGLTTYAALSGQALTALVGFMIVSLALGSAVLLLTMIRLGECVSDVAGRLGCLEDSLVRMEESLGDLPSAIERAGGHETMDLCAGERHAASLVAARIDAPGPYPRIVPVHSAPRGSALDPATRGASQTERPSACAGGTSTKPAETAGDDSAGTLRREFGAAVRERDFSRALCIGARIVTELPGHAMARDFLRIEPLLRRRADGTTGHNGSVHDLEDNPSPPAPSPQWRKPVTRSREHR